MLIIDWEKFIRDSFVFSNKNTARSGYTSPCVSMTVGVFDGVHRGHRALIERIVSHNGIPVVVTFREHGYKEESSIQTFEEKAAALEDLGVEVLIVIKFDENFSRTSGIDFLETLAARSNIGFFAVGANFRCGCGLDTDAASVKDFFAARGIPVEIVPEVLYNGEPVSSSRIRAALAAGNMELAASLSTERDKEGTRIFTD